MLINQHIHKREKEFKYLEILAKVLRLNSVYENVDITSISNILSCKVNIIK